MKKIILVLAVMIGSLSASCQDFGLSFSYFLPRNGYFSTPISPFSFRGLGVNLNRFVALETGASLYRMSGLNVTGTSMKTRDPLVGPNFTIFVPGELVLQFAGKKGEFDLKAGGFFFYGFDQKLNYGNLDRAIRILEGWDVANSSFDFKNNPGFGYHFGAELTVNINKQFGVSLETNYLIGSSKLPLTGNYSGGILSGTNQTKSVDFSEAKVDFTGLEFSIGVIMKSGRR